MYGSAPKDVDMHEATPENKNRNWILYREPLNDYEIAMLEHTRTNSFLYRSEPLGYDDFFSIKISELEVKLQTVRNHYERDAGDGVAVVAAPPVRQVVANGVEVPYVHIGFDADAGDGRTCNLRRLSLRGYPNVTDAALRYLSHLELELLDVTHTAVTDEGVRRFASLHPQCRVVHESMCTCGPKMHF